MFLGQGGGVSMHSLSASQVPERLTQFQYEAEDSGAITKLLGGGTVLVGQLWLTGVNTHNS